MVLNKRGQTGFFYLIMIGITMFIIGFALANVLVTNNTQVRTNLDCGNESIDTSQQVTCTMVDIVAPWFIGLIFGLGGLALGAKIQFG